MANRISAILREMRQAVGWIEADVAGLDLARFVGNRRARQLVERNLEILSEASRRVPPELRATEPGVDWVALASLGPASPPPQPPHLQVGVHPQVAQPTAGRERP